jgi:hypothetical protein
MTTTKPIRFVYAKTSAGRKATIGRKATVAYYYNDEDATVRIEGAACSKKDQFVKKIGRAIAAGRLAATGGTMIPYSTIGGTTYKEVAGFIVANIDYLVK